MDETYSTKAIVIRRMPFRESDSIVTFFCRDYGKKDLVARGVKKPGSKLAGHIELITLVDLMAVRGKQFDYLGSAISRDSFVRLKGDLMSVSWAMKGLEKFNKWVKIGDNTQADEIFILLSNFLSAIEQGIFNPEIVYYLFLFKYIAITGYAPKLDRCVIRDKAHDQNVNKQEAMYFSYSNGGVIIGGQEMYNDAIIISEDLLELLKQNLNINFSGSFIVDIENFRIFFKYFLIRWEEDNHGVFVTGKKERT